MLYFSPLSVTDDNQRDRKHTFSFPQCKHKHKHKYKHKHKCRQGNMGLGGGGYLGVLRMSLLGESFHASRSSPVLGDLVDAFA